MENNFMKRIYASLGLVAIGAASIQSVHGQSTDPSRWWSASASLHGFYDDNVNTQPKDRVDSFGFEVSPSLSLNLPLEQTSIAASYTYDFKWYDKQVNGQTGHNDQTHTLAAQLRHAFSERLSMSVQDSFVIGQEPDTIRVANSALATNQRIPGNNIRNYGSILFNAQITRPFGIEVGYANALYNYEDDKFAVATDDAIGSITGIPGNPLAVQSSFSGSLDRMEHTPHIDGRWQMLPDTVGIIGYQFGTVSYTQNQPIGVLINAFPAANEVITSRDRNSMSHYGYVGLEHTFRPDLVGTIKGGARYSDFYNSPSNDTTVSPYGQGSLRWTYAKESFLDFGVSYDLSATDQFSTSQSDQSITVGADTFVAYVALTHRIMPNLFGSLGGNYQHSTFIGGDLDDKTQNYYSAGANLEYRFNRHVSANVSYNYDLVDSDSGVNNGDYHRNRIFLGATFVY
jgi:hypothetical protein